MGAFVDEKTARLLRNELRKMEVPGRYRFEEIQRTGERLLCRIYAEGTQYVLKYFCHPEAAQEIQNYQILGLEEIPTIPLLHYTSRCLLLEDLTVSQSYRLGTPHDLENEVICRSLGRWYRFLHDRGSGAADLPRLPRETDLLTAENVVCLRERFGAFPDWEYMRDMADRVRILAESLSETLVYNDFDWTNLAVAKDGSIAFPFDYHMLGRGHRFGDVRNVCVGLSREASWAFLQGYGSVNRDEIPVDAAASPVISLLLACERPLFPVWAEKLLEQLQSGDVGRCWRRLLEEN